MTYTTRSPFCDVEHSAGGPHEWHNDQHGHQWCPCGGWQKEDESITEADGTGFVGHIDDEAIAVGFRATLRAKPTPEALHKLLDERHREHPDIPERDE